MSRETDPWTANVALVELGLLKSELHPLTDPSPAGSGTRAGEHAPVAFRPASPQRAFDQIITQIRAKIEDRELRPGDRLPSERALAEQFAVSRNTVREAIRMLEIAGLVKLKRGATGGSFIAAGDPSAVATSLADALHLTDFSLADLTETLCSVCSIAAVTACERLTEDDLAKLEANVEKAAELTNPRDWEEKVRLHLEFHELLAEATGNPILLLIMRTLLDVACKVIIKVGPVGNQPIIRSRRILLKALRERDADLAVLELGRYFDRLHKLWLTSSYADGKRARRPDEDA